MFFPHAIDVLFDENSNLIFTAFGPDMAAGIEGAISHNNIPDCTVEVMKFNAGSGLSMPNFTTATPGSPSLHGYPNLADDALKSGTSLRILFAIGMALGAGL